MTKTLSAFLVWFTCPSSMPLPGLPCLHRNYNTKYWPFISSDLCSWHLLYLRALPPYISCFRIVLLMLVVSTGQWVVQGNVQHLLMDINLTPRFIIRKECQVQSIISHEQATINRTRASSGILFHLEGARLTINLCLAVAHFHLLFPRSLTTTLLFLSFLCSAFLQDYLFHFSFPTLSDQGTGARTVKELQSVQSPM